MKYYNTNYDVQYLLHFADLKHNPNKKLFSIINDYDINVNISDKITLISICNEKCASTSPLYDKIMNNKIKCNNVIINPLHISSTKWDNYIKVKELAKILPTVKTEYCLIVDLSDVIFVNDLDETFIETFESLNSDVIFNGQNFLFPALTAGESPLDILLNGGDSKFLNGGICFGKTNAVCDFYSYTNSIMNKVQPSNTWGNHKPSEQYLLRIAKYSYNRYKVNIDSHRKLFTACLNDCQFIKVNDNKTVIEVKGIN